jgi:hypothetical protein
MDGRAVCYLLGLCCSWFPVEIGFGAQRGKGTENVKSQVNTKGQKQCEKR